MSGLRRTKLVVALILISLTMISGLYLIAREWGENQLEYSVKPLSPTDKSLSVKIRVMRNRFFGPRTFSMHSNGIKPTQWKSEDNLGHKVPFTEKDGTIQVGSLDKFARYVDISYVVQVGKPGNSGYEGEYMEDLLTFSGQDVLMFPDLEPSKNIFNFASKVSNVTIQTDTSPAWNSIVPYQGLKTGKQRKPLVIRHPAWKDFYNLGKSSYAFGNFTQITVKGAKGSIPIVLDKARGTRLSAEEENIVRALYDYYAGIFGKRLEDDYSLVFLRKALTEGNKIVSGVSGKSLGMSLDLQKADDIKMLSHSLYTAFFDSQIDSKELHYAPNLWLYRGLATYYETLSLDALPAEIRKQYELSSESNFDELYSRYIYFRLKEPALFKVSPAYEYKGLSGQLQFFHYTESPLIVKIIEDMAYKQMGKRNAMLSYFKAYATEDSVNQGILMRDLVGDQDKTVLGFVSGNTLLPFPEKLKDEVPDKTVQQLDEYENLLDSWFLTQAPNYPFDRIYLLDPDQMTKEITKRDLHFASADIEAKVGNYSPTIALLLEQYRLRAEVAGEKDMNDPALKYKLLTNNDDVKKWSDFLLEMEAAVKNGTSKTSDG